MGSTTNSNNLKQTVAKGFFWGGLSNMVCQLFSLLFGVYLARILGPGDYGPIGMLAIFSAIAGSLQDSGFVAALAGRKSVTHDDYNAVFWFNIIINILDHIELQFFHGLSKLLVVEHTHSKSCGIEAEHSCAADSVFTVFKRIYFIVVKGKIIVKISINIST